MDSLVQAFFVEDIRNMAPAAALLPPQEDVINAHLWGELIIDLYRDEIRYTSSTHRYLSYCIPFLTPGELHYHHLRRIAHRFKTLVGWGCVKRVAWNVHSSPHKRVNDLIFQCFNAFKGVNTIAVEIPPHSGRWGARMVGYLWPTFPVDNLVIKIRQGHFSGTRLGLCIIECLYTRPMSTWTSWVRLHIEMAKVSIRGQKMLEKIAPLIELITFDVVDDTNESAFNCALSLLHSTRTKMELSVTKWDLKGVTTIPLPRGNLSISIETISRDSSVVISCNEELSCLTVGKGALEHISGPKLSIYDLRATDEPDNATLMELRYRFSRVFRVSRLAMCPRLSALRGQNLWLKHL